VLPEPPEPAQPDNTSIPANAKAATKDITLFLDLIIIPYPF
jgi:hypothetical protein